MKKTLWLSGIRMGRINNHSQELYQLLEKSDWQSIFLVGNIFEIDALAERGFFTAEEKEVLGFLSAYRLNRNNLYYFPNSRESLFRLFVGKKFGNIEVLEEALIGNMWVGNADKWRNLRGIQRSRIIRYSQEKQCYRLIVGGQKEPERLSINNIDYISIGDWSKNLSWIESTAEVFNLHTWQ